MEKRLKPPKQRMTNTPEQKNWQQEFDEKFKCIQSDCDGKGNIPAGNEEDGWYAEQCEFHAKYLFPLKSFIQKLLVEAEERGRGEAVDYIEKNNYRRVRFDSGEGELDLVYIEESVLESARSQGGSEEKV